MNHCTIHSQRFFSYCYKRCIHRLYKNKKSSDIIDHTAYTLWHDGDSITAAQSSSPIVSMFRSTAGSGEGSHPAGLGQTVEDGEHQFGVGRRVVRQADGERVTQHLVQTLGEQRLRKLAQVVLQHSCRTARRTNVRDQQHLV